MLKSNPQTIARASPVMVLTFAFNVRSVLGGALRGYPPQRG